MTKLPVTLKAFPFKDSPVKGFGVILFILVLSILVFLLTNSLVFTICATFFIIFDLKTFFFPTQFVIYDNRIEKKFLFNTVSHPIERFKTVINCKNGILLSPYKNRSTLLEKIRGLYIICSDSSLKKDLLSFFRDKIHFSQV